MHYSSVYRETSLGDILGQYIQDDVFLVVQPAEGTRNISSGSEEDVNGIEPSTFIQSKT